MDVVHLTFKENKSLTDLSKERTGITKSPIDSEVKSCGKNIPKDKQANLLKLLKTEHRFSVTQRI